MFTKKNFALRTISNAVKFQHAVTHHVTTFIQNPLVRKAGTWLTVGTIGIVSACYVKIAHNAYRNILYKHYLEEHELEEMREYAHHMIRSRDGKFDHNEIYGLRCAILKPFNFTVDMREKFTKENFKKEYVEKAIDETKLFMKLLLTVTASKYLPEWIFQDISKFRMQYTLLATYMQLYCVYSPIELNIILNCEKSILAFSKGQLFSREEIKEIKERNMKSLLLKNNEVSPWTTTL